MSNKNKYFPLFLLLLTLTMLASFFPVFKNRSKKSPTPFFIPTPTIAPTPSSPSIILLFAGDLSLSREINYQIKQKGNPSFPFEKIAPILNRADWVTANLEGPVIKNCPIFRTGFKFCGDSHNTQSLFASGLKSLNLANNHIGNFGTEGISQTIETLKKESLVHFGLGKVDFQTIAGIKLAFLGFDDTLSPLDKTQLKDQIEKVDRQADWVIVNFHWGEEYQKEANERQEELAKLAINSGADIIIGHHPHVVQPLEYFESKPIFYSLGNFVFDQLWSQDTRKGILGKITLDKERILKVETIPIYINDEYQPELISL